MKFSKPSFSTEQQIALLNERGLSIPDPQNASHYLRHISYYRLRAYWLPLEVEHPNDTDHCFADGASFEDALALYVFDRELRLLVMDAIERIEVSVRGHWSYHLAMKYGSHGYLRPENYLRADRFATAFSSLIEETERSKDTFVKHYKRKYGDPEHLPIWMASEVMSLGHLSKWLGNLKLRSDRQAIARAYGLDEKVLVSVTHHLTYVRNICAHHSRLWNKQFTVTMTVPTNPAALSMAMNSSTDRLLYNTLVVIGYLMDVIAPGSGWRTRLILLRDSCPLAPDTAMGFPDGWRDLAAWKKP